MAARLTKSARSSRGEFAGIEQLVLADRPSEPPPAPAWLDAEATKIFGDLYAAPVAQLWRPEDVHLVARRCSSRHRLAGYESEQLAPP